MNKNTTVLIVAGLAVAAGVYIAMKHGDKILDKAGVKNSLKTTIWEAVSTRLSVPDMRARATAGTTATPLGFGKLF